VSGLLSGVRAPDTAKPVPKAREVTNDAVNQWPVRGGVGGTCLAEVTSIEDHQVQNVVGGIPALWSIGQWRYGSPRGRLPQYPFVATRTV
jgi:hypothetical protein